MAEPALSQLRLVAVTMPGFGGTTAPEDVRVENYARLMARCAADPGCDVAVGHSLGANVVIEMAAGPFEGSLVLLSPTFSRADQAAFLAVMNALGRAPGLGIAGWTVMLKPLPKAMKRELPAHRAEALAADMAANAPATCRRSVRRYHEYPGRHPSLVPRLCESGAPAWVFRGDHDEIGLTDGERRDLEPPARQHGHGARRRARRAGRAARAGRRRRRGRGRGDGMGEIPQVRTGDGHVPAIGPRG
ncbi:alpha/beta fold hydrolase [Streptomyces spinosirectus]